MTSYLRHKYKVLMLQEIFGLGFYKGVPTRGVVLIPYIFSACHLLQMVYGATSLESLMSHVW